MPNFLSNQYNRGFFLFSPDREGAVFHGRWKATPRLTLTLDYAGTIDAVPREIHRLVTADIQSIAANKFEVITPGNHAIQTLPGIPPSVLESWAKRGLKYTTAEAVGYPSNLFLPSITQFRLRVGVAFKLDNKTALRGGYGEYGRCRQSQLLATGAYQSAAEPALCDGLLRERSQITRLGICPPPMMWARQRLTLRGLDDSKPTDSIMASGTDATGKMGVRSRGTSALNANCPGNSPLRASYIGELGRDLEQRFSLNPEEGKLQLCEAHEEARR
ncbi:MAG: hypothetical protein U0Y68_16100 [Blastocatellia bacterium]